MRLEVLLFYCRQEQQPKLMPHARKTKEGWRMPAFFRFWDLSDRGELG
jgi:hypothetical protein